MKIKTDLHMHSCLSPCGDDEMTPCNLVNMAWINGLDAIALCDHNTAQNLPAAAHMAKERDIVLLPGLEVTTREDVHVLTYFPAVDAALAFSKKLYEYLPSIPNSPKFFGEQIIRNELDEPIGTEPKLLISAVSLNIDQVVALAMAYGGLCVSAHINRGANGILSSLGFIPPQTRFAALEVSRKAPMPEQNLGKYNVLYASDAHRLEDISMEGELLEVDERSVDGVFRALQHLYEQTHGKST